MKFVVKTDSKLFYLNLQQPSLILIKDKSSPESKMREQNRTKTVLVKWQGNISTFFGKNLATHLPVSSLPQNQAFTFA